MRRKLLSVHSLIATLLVFTGCNSLMSLVEDIFPSNEVAETTIITTSGNAVLDAVYKNLEAANTENLDLYMSTVHPESVYFDSTRGVMANTFATYDLNYDITELEIVEQTETEARVRFTLVTTRVSGPAFNDNIVTGVFILHPDGDEWKIYDQTIDNMEYIND
ncbi:MAG: hypothetical protein F9K27_04555 [Anaerolineae bacterium]|nr:MAG: hypothetical protein F9K27_04555 [Anaerolineae bacterium]